MPVKLTKKETEALLAKPATKTNRTPITFADEIASLKSGESLFITKDEWTIKTTISNYYASKGYIARKNKTTGEMDGESTIEIKKANRESVDGWVLMKLK